MSTASTAPETAPPVDRPTWELYSKCIHCGLCLNACPTYRLLGTEADSPRGRIHQMILVEEGRLPLADSFVRHIDLCLDCRACETACPSGVQYGRLVESARAQIEQSYRRPLIARLLRSLGLRHLLPHPGRMAFAGRLLRIYQRTGLQRLVRRSGVLRLFGSFGAAEALLPVMDGNFFYSELGKVFPAEGERRARVAFFAGCMQQVAFAELNRATIRVLQKNGCDVIVPEAQVCCGALQTHAGMRGVARELAVKNAGVFLGDDFDAVITNTAGCGSTLKEYEQLFPPGDKAQDSARAFSAKVKDATEFLAKLPLRPPRREVRLRVTVQDSCHLLHGQKVGNAPRELLRAIPGVEIGEMKLAGHCCGSAGIYNLLQPDVAGALLKEKMEDARSTHAQAIVTSNPGCILQLRAGVERHHTGQQVFHVLELLDRAYRTP